MAGDFESSVDYLFSLLPQYQKSGVRAYKGSLDNIVALCRQLGNPQETFKSIHIAGTNGKGSTTCALASVLIAQGYKVGHYTSPHLYSFRERIQVDGQLISEAFVVDFVKKIKVFIEQLHPSFFEVTVAMAFDYFAHSKVEFAVVETGLGGRLDSTNILNPILSVVTTIGLDHQAILGDTLQAIAREKAGIIKSHVPVVIGHKQADTQLIFREKADSVSSSIYFAEDDVSITVRANGAIDIENEEICLKNLTPSLKGAYQVQNLYGVVAALSWLMAHGVKIDIENVKLGLSCMRHYVSFYGRYQKIRHQPLVICDVAHNPQGVKSLFDSIGREKYVNMYVLMAFSRDKAVRDVLSILPSQADYILPNVAHERVMPCDELLAFMGGFDSVEVVSDLPVEQCLNHLIKRVNRDDIIVVFGSIFLIAELNLHLLD